MAKSVDQKVVQMQFDNQNFEQNAKQTMSTLDKLKAALKFDGANKGAEDLAKGIKNVGTDFSQCEIMATKAGFHIQDVWLKLSNVLEYQIARKIINLGENMLKSLSLDQVTAGFNEYELKMGSIQTIMAGTGESLEVVNKYLNELNTYSDKTIYSFSDMTQNIGKFTNAGVNLKDAVAAIQGVANVAAVSGANANEASRAMYNFAQALSAGYVKLIDWKSIENANMATVEFKDTLLQTAAAMGYAEDKGNGMYKVLTRNAQGKVMDSAISATKNFNDSLAYQWMKTEVLTQALEIYSKDVRAMTEEEKAAYEAKLKSKGFTDEQIKAFEELGIKATKAASEVKTFSQLMDTIKESIGSGWAMSFEHIIGNFNEAKELFTEINDEVGIVIGKIDSQRNKMLENWKRQGGREDLIQAFRNLAGALSDLFTPVKQVFDELFGRLDSDKLLSITKGFREWTASLRMNKDEQESFRVTLHYLLVPVKILIESIKIIIGIIPHVISLGVNLIKFLASLVQYIIYVVRNSETFQTVLNGIKVALGTLKAGVVASIKFFKELATTISRYVVVALKDSNSWLNKTINLFKALGAITLAGLRAAFNSIANFKFSNITDGLEKMKARLTEIGQSSKIVQFFLDAFEKLKVGFQALGDAFGIVIDSLQSRLENVESFGDFLQAVWDSLKDGYNFLKEFIENKFFTEGPGLFDTIKQAFSDFMAVLEGGMDKIPWAKVILIAFTIALASCTINLITAISKFGGLAAALKETILIINNTIKTFTGLRNRLIELKEIAIFITAITASIAILSLIDKENGNLIKAAATLGILAAGLMILAEAMLWINTKNALAPASLANLFGSIAAIAAGTAILVAAAGALKDMSLSFKEALPYIETLGVLMLGMMGAMTVLTLIGKDKKIFTAGAMSILSYAGAVYILASALNKMAEIEFPNIKDLLKILGEVLLGFTAIIGLSGKFSSWSGFFSIIAFTASMKILAGVLQDLANLNMTEDAQKLVTQVIDLVKFFGVIVATVFTLVKIFGRVDIFTKLLTKNANKLKVGISGFAVNLLAVSASFLIISKAFETFKDNLTSGGDWGALLGLIAIFAAMVAGVAVLFAKISKCETNFRNTSVLLKFGAALLLFDAALVPLSLVLDLLADIVHNHDGGDLAIAATIIGGVGVLMGALMWASGQSSFTDFKVLLTIFGGMSLLLGELIAISVLVEAHGDAMLAALGVLLLTAIEMGGTIAGLALAQKKIGNLNISSLIAAVSGIVVLAGVLTGLTFLAASDVGKNIWEAFGVLTAIAGVMVGTMFGFAAIKKWIGPVGNVLIPLATVVGSMVILAGVLTGLTFLLSSGVGDQIYDALILMGIIIGGLVIALGALAKLTDFGDWATYLGFAAVIVAIAGSLVVMAQVPWDDLARAGIVLIGFVGAMELLFFAMTLIVDGTVGTAGLVMAGFAAAIVAITLSFTAFVSVCAKFVNAVKGLVLALIDLGIHGKDIAKGLREVVPEVQNAINKIAQSIMDASPKLATAVENIMIGISQGIAAGSSYIAMGIANAITILMPVADEALRTIGRMLLDGIETLITELALTALKFADIGNKLLLAFISGLLDKFGLSQLASVGGSWITAIFSSLIPGFDILFNAGTTAKDSFISGATPSSSEMDGLVTEYHDMGSAMGGAVYSGMSHELKQTKNLANSIPGTVSNAIQKAGNDGSKYAREATTKINNSFYAGWSDQDKMITQLKVKYGSLKNSITGGDGLLGGLKNLVSNGFTAVSDYISDKASPILNEYTKLIEQTTPDLEAAGKAAAGAGDGMEDMGKKAKKGAKGVKEAKDEIESFVEKIEGSFNILDEFDLGMDEENPLTGDKLLDNMRSNVEGMTQWSNEMVGLAGKMTTGLYKKLADMGPSGYKYVHAFAQMTTEQLDQVNQYYAQSLIIPAAVTAQVYQGMYTTASNAYTGFVNGLNVPEMQKIGVDCATFFLTGITGASGFDTHSPSKKTFQIGIYVTEGLSNGMKDPSAKEGLMYTIRNMCREIIEAFRLGLSADNFKDIGQQVLRGLNNGITSKNPDVLKSITNLCDAIEHRARTTLQINSPSKVFAKIGAGIPEGMAKGITDNVTMVESSTQKMAEATVENMRGAISTIQAIVDSDMDVEPVIRPVVDLSDVTSGASTLNSLMNTSFGTGITMPQANFMTSSQLISNTDNSNVVEAIGSLQEDIANLKDAMTNIKMVLDTGTMVGAMTPAIDQQLGRNMIYAGRGI